jgi:AMMECR1 domain-containing protein
MEGLFTAFHRQKKKKKKVRGSLGLAFLVKFALLHETEGGGL